MHFGLASWTTAGYLLVELGRALWAGARGHEAQPLMLAKLLLAPLNLFPSRVYEVHGYGGPFQSEQPRDLYYCVRGRQRLPLGCALIAWQRGAIFDAPLGGPGADGKEPSCRGVYTDAFQAIVRKWTF
ncbi:MAG TPA: hypothetical protein VMK42_21705 [Anaeromyxobacteraceae bacterium]|nr:hypothetical protein [Anaeromyxobacteraceae bacterium]